MKKTTKEKVLELLIENKGKSVSGQEIAQIVCVSRTSVWKAINALRLEGYNITGSTNVGYMIEEENNDLRADEIVRRLSSLSNEFYKVETVATIDSTNRAVIDRASSMEAEGLCIISKEQTKGRGRRGRSFYSPDSTGVYISVLLRPDLVIEDAVLITTAAAVAAAKANETENKT